MEWLYGSINADCLSKLLARANYARRSMEEVLMQWKHLAVCLALAASLSAASQETEKRKGPRPEDLSASSLISRPGPSFTVPQKDLAKETRIIVYGDQRFTDPADTTVTNPVARRLLVEKIAQEHPDAVLMSGDVPYSGDVVNDYEVYKTETSVWRDEHLHVFPALGNHEFHGDPQQALEHWWAAFPEMRNRRWYSVALGETIYTIALDSDASLAIGSDQLNWLNQQLRGLPASVKFIFISLHHPPVADFQTHINVSHNPRPNEITLRDDLESLAPSLKAQLIVCAGHIHNYERFQRNGVIYFVSGGGAASPVQVERSPEDLYQDNSFPNYHYLEFTIQGDTVKGKMVRLADVNAQSPKWEVKDTFRSTSK